MPIAHASTVLSVSSLSHDAVSTQETSAVRSENFLPRLLYIGDVPVTATVGGAALLYRLLQRYPADRLHVVQGNLWSEQQEWAHNDPTKRLQQVNYETLAVGKHRLLHSRFGRAYAGQLQLTAPIRARKFGSIVERFRPEAILTAVHGFSWVTAASVAAKYELPLHLIIHDDWTSGNQLPRGLRSWADKQFKRVYRQAASRLCASPYMMETYGYRYGIRGTVLYPSRGPNDLVFDAACDRPSSRFPAFAFAGTINSGGYAKSIVELARVLERCSGSVLLFTPHSEKDLAIFGLQKSNIIANPLIPQSELTSKLREEADVLFAPMTFEQHMRENMIAGFPSKITDYTATGRPLLIWGPKYCSAVRWALENPGAAEVVTENDIETLAVAVEKLVSDLNHRLDLAAKALTKGRECFSHAAATEIFYHSLVNRSI